MIDKITKSNFNTEDLILNPISEIKEKLDYYRHLLGKTHDLSAEELQALKQDVSTFFNLKPGGYTENAPPRLVRISNNNKILQAQGKPLSYLTEISQLLAPPIEYCGFGRCNTPNQRVLYCAVDEAGAYWETRPQRGTVITLSRFELKPDAKVNCYVVNKDKTKNPVINHELQEVYYLLEDFFVDMYSLEVSRERPRDYLFSGVLSSDMLFYPVVSDSNTEAIIYPSVQKKKYGENFGIKNDLIFEKYNLRSVETRFILDEYENLDPASDEVTTDQVISSFGTNVFDFERGKILYNFKKADEIFKLFRELQTGPGKQVRNEYPGIPKNIAFNISPFYDDSPNRRMPKMGRNDRVTVIYQNGTRKDNVKFKTVQDDIKLGKCAIIDR